MIPGLSMSAELRPVMLLWGCPIPPGTKKGRAFQAELIAASDAVGERLSSRTEPDVVIDAGDAGIVFIEMKLHSGNDVRTDDKRFERYLKKGTFFNPAAAAESGYYELVRNWSLGTAMAIDRPFHFVNLGPDRIFDEPKYQSRWQSFRAGIGNVHGLNFCQVRWSLISDTLSASSANWISDFVTARLNR